MVEIFKLSVECSANAYALKAPCDIAEKESESPDIGRAMGGDQSSLGTDRFSRLTMCKTNIRNIRSQELQVGSQR